MQGILDVNYFVSEKDIQFSQIVKLFCPNNNLTDSMGRLILQNENTATFFSSVLFSTLFHLPPLRFSCVGGCWDRTQDSCDISIGCQTL